MLDQILPLATVSDKMPLTLLQSTLTLAYFHVLLAASITEEGKLDREYVLLQKEPRYLSSVRNVQYFTLYTPRQN